PARTFCLSSYLSVSHLLSLPTRRSSDLDGAADQQSQPVDVTVPEQEVHQDAGGNQHVVHGRQLAGVNPLGGQIPAQIAKPGSAQDRKSTRLNSSHVKISYAVFCLKKKRT